MSSRSKLRLKETATKPTASDPLPEAETMEPVEPVKEMATETPPEPEPETRTPTSKRLEKVRERMDKHKRLNQVKGPHNTIRS